MFNPDGSLRTPDPSDEREPEPEREVAPTPAPEPAPAPVAAPAPEPPAAAAVPDAVEAEEPDFLADDEPPLPPERPGEPSMFSDLIVNLASQAAMYMGLVDNPLAPKMPTDLHAARQMIDILGMLQRKTKGNLSSDESVLLDRILTDLRMQFVSMTTPRR